MKVWNLLKPKKIAFIYVNIRKFKLYMRRENSSTWKYKNIY